MSIHPRKAFLTNKIAPPSYPAGRALTVASLALFLAVAGCKSPSTPTTDDASLNTAVQRRLQADPGLAGQPLQASVQSGIVTLSGNVDSAAAKSLAANDAATIPGVHEVINNLALGVPPTTPAAIVTPPSAPVKTVPAPRLQTKVAPEPDYRQSAPIERRDSDRRDQDRRDQDRRDHNVAQNQQPGYQQPQPATAAPAIHNVTVPVGTGLSVRITQTLDSQSTQPGTTFSGVLASDVIVDGLVAFPTGTRVSGRVDDAKDAGHFSGNSLLAISLTGINRRGESIPITTDSFSKEGNGRGKNTAEKVGGGAAVGAILGGIFGGGKGAAIGAGAGGGLGAGANGVTRGQQVQIPSESLVRFRLNQPVTVRAVSSPEANNGNTLQPRYQ